MNFEQAQDILEEIIDICYELDHPSLTEIIEPIYRDIQRATDIAQLIFAAEELQVCIYELDLTSEEEDIAQDVHEKIERLSE